MNKKPTERTWSATLTDHAGKNVDVDQITRAEATRLVRYWLELTDGLDRAIGITLEYSPAPAPPRREPLMPLLRSLRPTAPEQRCADPADRRK